MPGVVEEVLVKEGQAVTRGQPLIRFDLSKPRSELAAAESIRERLLNENLVARATLGEPTATAGLTANQRRQLRDRARELSSRLGAARKRQERHPPGRLPGLPAHPTRHRTPLPVPRQ